MFRPERCRGHGGGGSATGAAVKAATGAAVEAATGAEAKVTAAAVCCGSVRGATEVAVHRSLILKYGHHIYQSMDQPGKVANPARGQLNNIPLSPCVPENLVSRDGFSRPVPRQPADLHTQAESGAYLRDSSRVPRRRPL